MTASAIIFFQIVIFVMLVFVLMIGLIIKLSGRRASLPMKFVSIVLAISCFFIFFYQKAIYSGIPAERDISLGFPFLYAHAQSDAGLASFRPEIFAADLGIGIFLGCVLLWIYIEWKSHQKNRMG